MTTTLDELKKKNYLYKSLPADLKPHGFQFKIGKWYKTEGKLEICKNGFHASKNIIDAMGYVDCEMLAIVEVRGKSIAEDDKECWEEMRIIKTYKWTRRDSIALAIYAAELVIDIFEKKYPHDKRPRNAIEAAKKVLKSDTAKNRVSSASSSAAAYAASSAAYAASSSYAAASAAYAAYYAAYAAYASSAASYASSAASYASSASYATKIKQKCHEWVLKRTKKALIAPLENKVLSFNPDQK